MSSNAGCGEGVGVSANEYSCTHGAQISFGDLTPYLTYAGKQRALKMVNGHWTSDSGLERLMEELRRPKPMKRYSNNPNGVMMAVLGMSAAAMGTWW